MKVCRLDPRIFNGLLWCITLCLLPLLAEAQVRSDEVLYPYPEGDRGDIWIMAGQSNMDGHCAIRLEPVGPDPRILLFCMDNKWRPFEEPTIRMSFPHADMKNPLEYNHTNTPTDQARGCGSQFFFAKYVMEEVKRPIGIFAACTGKSMPEVWNPDKAKEGDDFIYGQMVQKIIQFGGRGKIKGMVWYQGESDALDSPSADRKSVV